MQFISLNHLPSELILEILHNLKQSDVRNCTLVNRRVSDLALSNWNKLTNFTIKQVKLERKHMKDLQLSIIREDTAIKANKDNSEELKMECKTIQDDAELISKNLCYETSSRSEIEDILDIIFSRTHVETLSLSYLREDDVSLILFYFHHYSVKVKTLQLAIDDVISSSLIDIINSADAHEIFLVSTQPDTLPERFLHNPAFKTAEMIGIDMVDRTRQNFSDESISSLSATLVSIKGNTNMTTKGINSLIKKCILRRTPCSLSIGHSLGEISSDELLADLPSTIRSSPVHFQLEGRNVKLNWTQDNFTIRVN